MEKSPRNNSELVYLVMMDFSEASYRALKYTISMAKVAKGSIHVFHIADARSVADSENALVVSSTIVSELKKIERKLDSIAEIIGMEGIDASTSFSFGNIINEFKTSVIQHNPDLVVFGKRKEKPLLTGRLTNYLTNKYEGSILVVDEESEFHENTKIALGCNDNTLKEYTPELIFSLDKNTAPPLTLIKAITTEVSENAINLPPSWKSNYEKDHNIKFACQNDSKGMNGLVEYIYANKVNLLCIGKSKRRNFVQKLLSKQRSAGTEIVNKVNIPILVLGSKS